MRDLRQQQVDVWHVTGDINPVLLFLPCKRTILTLHDIGRYKQLQGWRKWLVGKLWVEWPIRRARRTITVSEFTRSDIYTHFPKLKENAVSVIHNGVSAVFRRAPFPEGTQEQVILQVGTAVHKNLDTVIKALEGHTCTLVIIGRLSERQRSALKEANIAFENFVNLDEETLYAQYVRAVLILFVSLHEGFGLPVVEAQTVGRPVITSRCAALPEVAGDGAHYLEDPLDHLELRASINKVLLDIKYREFLVKAGHQNALRFEFDRMFHEYCELYTSLRARCES